MNKDMSIKKAAIINAASKYLNVIFQLIISAILARILTPQEYGTVAVIIVFTTFFTTLANVGFGTAVIQNKTLTKDDIDNIYTYTVYIALCIGIIFCAFSFPISVLYNNPIYIKLGPLLAIAVLFNVLNMIPNSLLMRDKNFIAVAVRTVIVYVSVGILTIILAILGYNYYALVIQAVLTAVLTFFWNYATTRPKFKKKPSIQSIRIIWSYSMYKFAENTISYLSNNLDNMLVGRYLGEAQLGYYNTAYNLTNYPISNLSGVITPILHPILADHQDDKAYLFEKYLYIHNVLGLLGAYAAVLCYYASYEIIYIIYGPSWASSVNCFKLLSFIVFTKMINSCTSAIFQSLGETKVLFYSSSINTAITIVAIVSGIIMGNIEHVALNVSLAFAAHYVMAQVLLTKYGFKIPICKFIYDARHVFGVFIALIFSIIILPDISFNNLIIRFIFKLVYVTAIFGAYLLITKQYKLFLNMLKREK
ncbi:MAG: polysaccharide biosynthesis protein [Herbinix sp.]|jgi:PST family polysaccharide transporter|nr:polysaccharide biosynthesis protein [Herbinix sp.]